MKNSTLATLNISSFVEQQHLDNYLPCCLLKWRQGQLCVSLGQQSNQPHLWAFESKQQLVECLKYSPIRIVRLDPSLGEVVIQHWVDACEQANKSVFLRVPTAQKLSRMTKRSSRGWQFKQPLNSLVAFFLLTTLSPIMLATVMLMCICSPGPIFYKQWYIGDRGRFFQLLKFRTTSVNNQAVTTALGYWMSKYNLDKLPRLWNVLRGEVRLIGIRPLTVSESVRLSLESQRQLKTQLEISEAQIRANNSKDAISYFQVF